MKAARSRCCGKVPVRFLIMEDFQNDAEEKSSAELNLVLNLPDGWTQSEMSEDRFEIIIKYSGETKDIEALADELGVQIVTLTGGYGAGYADRSQIISLALSPEVIYLTVGEYYRLY